jgi:hypothetical protein
LPSGTPNLASFDHNHNLNPPFVHLLNEAAQQTPADLRKLFAPLIPRSIPTIPVQQQLPDVILRSDMSNIGNQDEIDADNNGRVFPTSRHEPKLTKITIPHFNLICIHALEFDDDRILNENVILFKIERINAVLGKITIDRVSKKS